MVVEQVEAALHHGAELLILRQVGTDDLAQMVMGLSHVQNIAILPDGDMAVAGTGIELKFFIIECLADGVHQDVGILGGDLAGTVVDDGLFCVGLFLADGDDVAAEDDVGVLHGNTHTEGFQGGSAGIILLGIIAQHCEICHIAAGFHRGRNGPGQTHGAFSSQFVHGRSRSAFQRRSAAQRFQGLISHAIAQDDDILHRVASSSQSVHDRHLFYTY